MPANAPSDLDSADKGSDKHARLAMAIPFLRRRPVVSPFVRRFSLSLVGWATWLPVVIWFNSKVVDVCAVNGASMYPFLNEDADSTRRRDLVVNWKWNPEENLEKGMVVTFRYGLEHS